MVINQHRDDRKRVDAARLDKAVQHLRTQIQHAVSSGWTGEVVDGRHMIVTGSDAVREPVAETTGLWADPVQKYLLTVQPLHMLALLSLLEAVAREIRTAGTSLSITHAALELAGRLLDDGQRPARRGRTTP